MEVYLGYLLLGGWEKDVWNKWVCLSVCLCQCGFAGSFGSSFSRSLFHSVVRSFIQSFSLSFLLSVRLALVHRLQPCECVASPLYISYTALDAAACSLSFPLRCVSTWGVGSRLSILSCTKLKIFLLSHFFEEQSNPVVLHIYEKLSIMWWIHVCVVVVL